MTIIENKLGFSNLSCAKSHPYVRTASFTQVKLI